MDSRFDPGCYAFAGLAAGALLSVSALVQAQSGAATFTLEQARRGQTVYAQYCAACHGAALEGNAAVALTGPIFRKTWSRDNVNTEDLHYIIGATMPPQTQNSLDESQIVDVLAFILQRNGVAAGEQPLTADPGRLMAVRMRSEDTVVPQSIEGSRREPRGRGPSARELLSAAGSADDWLYHTRDYRGTRYSPLDEIDVRNAHELRPECIYQLGDSGNFQTGPLVYDGVMYITGLYTTAAIDAADCRQIWRHTWAQMDREGQLSNRGAAIKDGYVVRGTTDGYLLALDAADGELIWARQLADPWQGEAFTMPPMIVGDRILIGPAGSERGVSGWIGAFALEDGEPIWKFETVPGASRAGGETWGNPTGIVIGGGAVWTPMSYDAGANELYVAIGNPAPDHAAALRPGANLYTNSIVALDVDRGELSWYAQFVPADDHDWDHTQVSPIFDLDTANGERKLIATAGKDGMLRVLDRDTHELVYGAEVARRENVDAEVTVEGVWGCPGLLGGVQWNGPALHRGRNLLVIAAVNNCGMFYRAENFRFVDGELYMGGRFVADRSTWSGWISAVDAASGELRWRYSTDQPIVAAVTTTAGNLVLTGELNGDFSVLDAFDGERIYAFNTGGPVGGGVITYAVEGRQFIAVASGMPSPNWIGDTPGAATVVVFALPD